MNPGEFKMASTGIAVAIPKGYFGLIAPRSGMATKQGIMLRSSNIVDSDYRGEVKLALWHCGIQTAYLMPGDRVAQMVLIPHCVGDVSELETLTVTGRGEGGFGSTGK
jgi:dUTP pyrophosphatase